MADSKPARTAKIRRETGETQISLELNLDGTAENISLAFSGSSDEYLPITINGAICDFTPRRALR